MCEQVSHFLAHLVADRFVYCLFNELPKLFALIYPVDLFVYRYLCIDIHCLLDSPVPPSALRGCHIIGSRRRRSNPQSFARNLSPVFKCQIGGVNLR